MPIALVPCPRCDRHVRCGSERCPFCETPIPAGLRPVPPAPRRLGRGAAFVFASSVAALGCSSTAAPTSLPTDAATANDAPDEGSGAVLYGLPAPDARPDDGSTMTKYGGPPAPEDAAVDDGSSMVKYGGPPVDAGADDGSTMAKYGGPPVDAGSDSGSPGVRYGAPPFDAGAG